MIPRRASFIVFVLLASAFVRPMSAAVLFDDALAEPREAFLVGVDVEGLPYKPLKNPPAAATQKGLEIQQTEAGLLFGLPTIEAGQNHQLKQQVRFDSLFLTYQEFNSLYGQEVGNLYEFSYRLQDVIDLGNKWTLNPSAMPGFFNDGEGWSGRNFKIQGGVVVDRSFSTDFNAGLGVVYTNVFGRPLLLPALTLSSNSARTRCLVELPFSAEAWFKESEMTEWGLVARVRGNEYGLNKPDVTEGKSMEYSTTEIGPSALFHMGPGQLQLDFGYTLSRRLKAVDGTTQAAADITPENAFFIRVSGAFQTGGS